MFCHNKAFWNRTTNNRFSTLSNLRFKNNLYKLYKIVKMLHLDTMLQLTKHLPFTVLYVSVVPQDLTIQYAIFLGLNNWTHVLLFLQILFRGCEKRGILFGVKLSVRMWMFVGFLYQTVCTIAHCTEITHLNCKCSRTSLSNKYGI